MIGLRLHHQQPDRLNWKILICCSWFRGCVWCNYIVSSPIKWGGIFGSLGFKCQRGDLEILGGNFAKSITMFYFPVIIFEFWQKSNPQNLYLYITITGNPVNLGDEKGQKVPSVKHSGLLSLWFMLRYQGRERLNVIIWSCHTLN